MNISLRYLFLIRLFAMTGLVAGLVFMQAVFALDFPLLPVIGAIAALGAYSLWSWRRLRGREQVTDATLLAQLVADIAALAVVVYFTGGSVNPFISLFMLPVIFAAAGMQLRNAALVAAVAFAVYTALMFFHRPLGDVHDHAQAARLHLWGMWYGFALSAALVAFFVARIGAALRRREQALAAAREERLRADKAVALGTLAAGTAHELATPLSTIAVLCEEIEEGCRDRPELADDLKLLAEQVERCKAALAGMSTDAGSLQARDALPMDLAGYLEELLADWRACRPETDVRLRWVGERPACRIGVDRTLTQALTNLLHNAADAASEGVTIELGWSDDALHLRISDDGPGIDRRVESRLGREPVTTKDEGMGIGLLLAQTTISRLGGRVLLDAADSGGTVAAIELPLAPLRTAA